MGQVLGGHELELLQAGAKLNRDGSDLLAAIVRLEQSQPNAFQQGRILDQVEGHIGAALILAFEMGMRYGGAHSTDA